MADAMISQVDPRRRYYVAPTRLVWTGPTTTVDAFDSLDRDDASECVIHAGDEGASIIVDFGREWHGSLQILATALRGPDRKLGPADVRLRFGESVSEVLSQPNNDHAVHDMTVRLPFHSHSEHGQTGFRFVRLDVPTPGWRLALRGLRAVALEHPWDRLGEFQCDDEQVNDIWRTAVRTAHLCCQEFIWDGIKRDRLAWAGDVHPQAAVLSLAFGRQPGELFERTLLHLYQTRTADKWVNGACTYSLWWIRSLADWFVLTGDAGCLERLRLPLAEIVRCVCEHVDEDGREHFDGWRFLDWSCADDLDQCAPGVRALACRALSDAAGLLATLGEAAQADVAQRTAQALRTQPFDPGTLKQNAVLGVQAGLLPAEQAARTHLADDGLRGGVSSWFGGYYLELLAQAGSVDRALRFLRSYWGGMLELGATSFWEHFDPAWRDRAGRIDQLPDPALEDVHADRGEHCYAGTRHSLCHGWAGGPGAWLIQWVLGVRPLSPGWSKTAVVPAMGDLHEVRGQVPTPAGPIVVRHGRLRNGQVETDIQAPDEVVIHRTVSPSQPMDIFATDLPPTSLPAKGST